MSDIDVERLKHDPRYVRELTAEGYRVDKTGEYVEVYLRGRLVAKAHVSW